MSSQWVDKYVDEEGNVEQRTEQSDLEAISGNSASKAHLWQKKGIQIGPMDNQIWTGATLQ